MLYLSSPSSSLASNTSNSFSLPTTYPVEQCVCPAPYQGLSCEICARGFARPSESIGDDCIRSVTYQPVKINSLVLYVSQELVITIVALPLFLGDRGPLIANC